MNSISIIFYSIETCAVEFPNHDDFRTFTVIIKPGAVFIVVYYFHSVTCVCCTVHHYTSTWFVRLFCCPYTYMYVDEGYWKGGIFIFNVQVPEDYNNKVCVCVCLPCN